MPSSRRGRDIEKIVAEQVRRWELESQTREKPAEKKEPTTWPIITISRAFGAQGLGVGKLLAQQLGFDFWDRQILHAIAERSGVRESLLTSLDEHSRSVLQDFVDSFSPVSSDALDYTRQLSAVLRTLSHHGSAVVVGRGAQFVVRPARALRVRLVGPLEERARAYADVHGLDLADARTKVEQVDRERATFCKQTFGEDLNDPNHYDVVVNSLTFGLEQARDLILRAYQLKFDRLPKPPAGD